MLRALADRHGGRSSLPGRRQATALVVDLVESTPLAERYDVEVYGSVLRAFELACRPVVESHEGHFVDVQGDAIVACFGYPLGHEDDASRAVSAGLDMLAALRPVAARLQAELGVEMHARIGIDTGIVVINGVGVLGPALNRAARLQALAAPDTVLISATTNQLVAGRFDTQPLGPKKLKGVDAPVEVHRVIRRRDPARRARALALDIAPFIGRDAELQRVLDLWNRAPAAQPNSECVGEPGQASLVLITGEPGIGKSRLASAVVQRVVEAGARVFEVYCSSYSVTSTLYPVRTAIERYANMSSDGHRCRAVGQAGGGSWQISESTWPRSSLPWACMLDLETGRPLSSRRAGADPVAGVAARAARRRGPCHGVGSTFRGGVRGSPLGGPDHAGAAGPHGRGHRPQRAC